MLEPLPRMNRKLSPGRLGFYEYIMCLECPVGGLSNQKVLESGKLPSNVPTKQQIIGNIYHELMEQASTSMERREFLVLAEKLIDRNEIQFADFIRENKLGRIKSWSGITKSIRAALEVCNRSMLEKAAKPTPVSLKSPDGRFIGIPDKFYIEGLVGYITEYKSADLYLEGKLNAKYLEQVKFYSTLAHLVYPELEKFQCVVKSLNGKSETRSFCADELEDYYEKISDDYEEIALGLNTFDKNFIEDLCIYCDKAVICSEFEKKSISLATRKSIFLFSGLVTNLQPNGEYVFIETEKYGLTVAESVAKDISIGKIYTFYRLTKRNNGELVWGTRSGIYEH